MLFLRVIAWCGDEKFSLKKSCFYLYIRRRDGHDLRQDIIDHEIVQHIFEIFRLTVQMCYLFHNKIINSKYKRRLIFQPSF